MGHSDIEQLPDLTGYVTIVTGGNSGIGYETALQLAKHGARVYIAARSPERIAESISRMKESSHMSLDLCPLHLDLQSLRSVVEAARTFMKQEDHLDILINNAGIMAVPFARTVDGFEKQWQTNYLGPFLFVESLLPVLQKTAANAPSKSRVRIVNVSSDAATQTKPKDGINISAPNLEELQGTLAAWRRYAQSKRASIVHARALHDRLFTQHHISAFAVHPGIVPTNLQSADPTLFGSFIRHAVRWRIIPGIVMPAEGALSSLYCATGAQAVTNCGGKFVRSGNKVDTSVERWTEDEALVENLWNESEKMIRDAGF